MLTYIKKNLIIAALEDSLLTGKKAAGIATLAEIETLLAALRSRLNADPDAVTDKSIWQMYARLNALKFPSVSNIWWAFNDLSMFDSVETETIGWSNITGKPAKFPPTAHAHDYASITDKPTTFEPSAHNHDYASITDKPTTFPPDAHHHDYASITDKPTTFPPDAHHHDYASITDKPTTFPPDAHHHDYASIINKPTTFPPADHAHDLLQIGGLLLRYNSTAGYLEQSANAGATWTPLVSESAPPSATAYALSWATITDNSVKISRSLPGAWINGDIQIWLRLSIDAATWGSYLLNAHQFYCSVGYDGAFGVHYFNNDGDEQSIYDARIGLTGWHDIGIQWTEASNSCIIYLDGVGGTAFYARKATVDTAGSYTLEIGAPKIQLSALVWGNALTWSAATAAKDTLTPVTMSLPLSEGSGATTTDSTGTAWTIPAGVVWEAV